MTEPELRHAAIITFYDIPEKDWIVIASIVKGYMETFALSDPDDTRPGLACLDALLAYFRRQGA